MKVEVTTVQVLDDILEVGFRCNCGTADAKWIGSLPRVGEEKYVEFDSDEKAQLGVNAARAACPRATIVSSDGVVTITAQLEAIYPDEGTVSLSFADGCIVLEVAESDLDGWNPGGWYTVQVAGFMIFDTNV